jgi:hypothetical protein
MPDTGSCPHDQRATPTKGPIMLDLLTWSPAAVFLGIIVILTTPFLGLIALLGLAVAALAALTRAAIVFADRLRHERSDMDPQEATQFVIREAKGGAR